MIYSGKWHRYNHPYDCVNFCNAFELFYPQLESLTHFIAGDGVIDNRRYWQLDLRIIV